MTGEALLHVEGMRTVFRRRGKSAAPAVNDFSLDLAEDQSLAIVGESGSGKSVSLRSLLRLLPKNGEVVSGRALYRGRDLLSMPGSELRSVRGKQIGMVFQNAMESLNPTLTLERQLSEVLRWHGICSKREAKRRAVQALDDVGIPNPEVRVKDYPFQFSGGMRQRAMIAMAIIAEPEIMIADEPTTALDVTVQLQILDLLKELRERRSMSLIMVTHDLGVARYVCDDALVMYQGDIVETGSMEQILYSPQDSYTKRLLSASIEIGDVDAAARSTEPAASHGAGSENVASGIHEPAPEDRAESAAEGAGVKHLLRAEGLVKTFQARGGEVRAVDDVTLGIPAGKTLGLVGESGSGKSTMARLIMGLQEPDEGRIVLDGEDLTAGQRGLQRTARRRMQMVFQNPFGSLLPHYTVGDNIMEPLRIQKIGSRSEREDKMTSLLELVGLGAEDAQRYPQQFSGGQQQRIGIARSLITDPEVLVCDEPTSALDTSIQAQIMDLLSELQGRLGLTVLLISHNLAVIETMSDHVAVMRSGRLVESGTRSDVFGAPQHEYTQQLLEAVLPIRSEGRGTLRAVGVERR